MGNRPEVLLSSLTLYRQAERSHALWLRPYCAALRGAAVVLGSSLLGEIALIKAYRLTGRKTPTYWGRGE